MMCVHISQIMGPRVFYERNYSLRIAGEDNGHRWREYRLVERDSDAS
jgi:hypothetical protein